MSEERKKYTCTSVILRPRAAGLLASYSSFRMNKGRPASLAEVVVSAEEGEQSFGAGRRAVLLGRRQAREADASRIKVEHKPIRVALSDPAVVRILKRVAAEKGISMSRAASDLIISYLANRALVEKEAA